MKRVKKSRASYPNPQPLNVPPLHAWDALPVSDLFPRGEISEAFMRRGVEDFRGAGRLLQSLPYGRNASPGHPLCVLSEGRGTCSTKHALLARLAVEQDQPIHLALGTYEMCEANTPGVGTVLERYDLPFV